MKLLIQSSYSFQSHLAEISEILDQVTASPCKLINDNAAIYDISDNAFTISSKKDRYYDDSIICFQKNGDILLYDIFGNLHDKSYAWIINDLRKEINLDSIQSNEIIKIGDKFGIISKNNKIIVPFEYDYIQKTIHDGVYLVSERTFKDNYAYLIDIKNHTKWTKLFLIWGINPMIVFFFSGIIPRIFSMIQFQNPKIPTEQINLLEKFVYTHKKTKLGLNKIYFFSEKNWDGLSAAVHKMKVEFDTSVFRGFGLCTFILLVF